MKALETMRKRLLYKSGGRESVYTLLQTFSRDNLVQMGKIRMKLLYRIEKIEVLRFSVMKAEEIPKIHEFDFIHKYRFHNLPQGVKLDLTELRAIYEASVDIEKDLSEENQRRLEWRVKLRTHIDDMIIKKNKGQLDDVLKKDIAYWEPKDIRTIEQLLKLDIPRPRFRELQDKLPLGSKTTLAEMEKNIMDAMSYISQDVVDERIYKLRDELSGIKGADAKAKMDRAMLELEIEEVPKLAQTRCRNRLNMLMKKDKLYTNLLRLITKWQADELEETESSSDSGSDEEEEEDGSRLL